MTTRNTIQRIKILEHLQQVHNHPTAEQVYKALKKEMPTLTLATVYRNLNVLAEQGIIVRLKVGHTYHYDGQKGSHAHGICKICGKVHDITIDESIIEPLRKKKQKGFIIEDAKVLYTGTCKKCS